MYSLLKHNASISHLLLNSKKFNNALMVDLLEYFKLPHLDLMRPHVGQLVESFHCYRLPSVLRDLHQCLVGSRYKFINDA